MSYGYQPKEAPCRCLFGHNFCTRIEGKCLELRLIGRSKRCPMKETTPPLPPPGPRASVLTIVKGGRDE